MKGFYVGNEYWEKHRLIINAAEELEKDTLFGVLNELGENIILLFKLVLRRTKE